MMQAAERKEIESVCTYCGVGCDITGVVEDNRIVKIYAQNDGVVSQGKLCIKGKYGYDFLRRTIGFASRVSAKASWPRIRR